MTAKEIRQSLRRGSFVYPFLAIQIFAIAATAVEFHSGYSGDHAESSGILNLGLLVSSGPFWWVVSAICLVLMPMSGVVLLAQELDEGNHELLLLTKLSRWKVVIGKFVSLWGICALTFVSLLPYVVVRYLAGGIEWWQEAACAATILGGSAMVSAGAIGASGFRKMTERLGVFALFLISMLGSCLAGVGGAALRYGSFGWLYHLTAVAGIVCFTAIGLALARSRLRLAVMTYEMKPSGMIVGLLVSAPFIVGITTAFTLGWGGAAGFIGITIAALRLDVTPGALKHASPPTPNLLDVVVTKISTRI